MGGEAGIGGAGEGLSSGKSTLWSCHRCCCLAACSYDRADLIYELPGGSCGRNHCVAHSQVSQEVHSMLVLLPITLLQQAQQLRVMSNGMGRGEACGSILAVQLTVDAAPDKAHDVLGQGACIAISISASVVGQGDDLEKIRNKGQKMGADNV